jgi:4-hydroxy-tetrahydrodipicolinate synthase
MDTIEGIIPPLVTPLSEEGGGLDAEGLARVVDHVIEGGVHGLFVLGTTGEGPSLTYEVRTELIERVCEQARGRVPVLVGLTDASLGQAVHVAGAAARFGAQAVVLAPPFYYQIDPRELHGFVDSLIDAIDLPVFLYDNPSLTGVRFDLDTVRALTRRPEVIGFKDSSGDAMRFHRLKSVLQEADIPLFVGPEELLAESLIMGADGGVPGGANIFPELYVGLYEAVQAGRIERALTLHERIMELSAVVYRGHGGGAYGSSRVVNGIKSALAAMGVCSAALAPPLKGASADKADTIRAFVARTRDKMHA